MDLLFEQPVYANDPVTEELLLKALQYYLTFHYDHNEMYRQSCYRK